MGRSVWRRKDCSSWLELNVSGIRNASNIYPVELRIIALAKTRNFATQAMYI